MDASPEIFRRTPDMISALAALDAASEMLRAASEKMEGRDYCGSFEQSRGALRVAASALLFKDGVIARTFEATSQHIESKYPETFPLKEWHSIEKTVTGEGPGLLNLLIKSTGRQTGEPEAHDALRIAADFLDKVKKMVLI